MNNETETEMTLRRQLVYWMGIATILLRKVGGEVIIQTDEMTALSSKDLIQFEEVPDLGGMRFKIVNDSR